MKQNSISKILRIAGMILAVVCVGILGSGLAESEEPKEFVEATFDKGVMSNEQAAEGYIYTMLGWEKEISAPAPSSLRKGGTARDRLGEKEQEIYDLLLPQIREVAKGERSSTIFQVNLSDVYEENQLQFTSNNAALSGWNAIITEWYSQYQSIVSALFADCPYELYWHGLSYGAGGGRSISEDNKLSGYLAAYISVSADYSATHQSGTYEFDTTLPGRIASAQETIQQILNANTGKNELSKLVAFKERICELTGYNYNALEYASDLYGDPWQLVYVFDGDPKTKVVCEGYSKAFQYLCDRSNLDVISVTGTMYGGTGSGRHMWNIVTIGGSNYLADITNSDSGTAGSRGELFLAGYSKIITGGYGFQAGSGSIRYIYDDDLSERFGDKLIIASAGYIVGMPKLSEDEYNGTLTWPGTETGKWTYTTPGGVDYPVSAAAARALTWKDRTIVLKSLPTGEDDLAVLNAADVDNSILIDFEENCASPTQTNNIPDPYVYTISLNTKSDVKISIIQNAINLCLKVVDNRSTGKKVENVVFRAGYMDILDPVDNLTISGRVSTTKDQTASVTGNVNVLTLIDSPYKCIKGFITGDITTMHFYGQESGKQFNGSCNVKGLIKKGFCYLKNTVSIAGITTQDQVIPVTGTRMIEFAKTDSQDKMIIKEGALNREKVNTPTEVNAGHVQLSYTYINENGTKNWYVDITPKDGNDEVAIDPTHVAIGTYNQNFDETMIIWAEDTDLTLTDISDMVTLTENTNGVDLNKLTVKNSMVNISCHVKTLEISENDGSEIALGDSGQVDEGLIHRLLGGKDEYFRDRYFGSVTSSGNLYASKQLNVMSWRRGEATKAILPSDAELVNKLAEEGYTFKEAGMDVRDSYLTIDENNAISNALNPSESFVAEAFYVYVYSYKQNSTHLYWSGESELTGPISLTINNLVGRTANIYRIYDNNGQIQAERMLTEPTADSTITFDVQYAGKYVVVSTAKNYPAVTVTAPGTYVLTDQTDSGYEITIATENTTISDEDVRWSLSLCEYGDNNIIYTVGKTGRTGKLTIPKTWRYWNKDFSLTLNQQYDVILTVHVDGYDTYNQQFTFIVSDTPVCDHDECDHYPAQPTTCTTNGNVEYWRCKNCGAYFNADKTSEITEEETVISATGHDWDTPTYVWTDNHSAATATRVCKNDRSHTETGIATVTSAVTTEATCEEAGVRTFTATFTNEAFATQTVTETIPALGHRWGAPSYVWAANNSSVTATRVCGNDAEHVETETANATGVVTTEATCEKAGVRTFTATFTNGAFTTQTATEVIPAINHSWGEPTYVWAADYSSVTATRVCGNNNSHTETEEGSITSAVTTEATCVGAGTRTYTATFTNSAFGTQTATEVIPATGHNYGEPTYTWAANYSTVTATRVCGNNNSHTETEAGAITSKVTKAATCEETGIKTYTATFTNAVFGTQTMTEVIPAINHNWGDPTYVWAADKSSVTATRVCGNDASHVETETANATGAVTTAATCGETGIRTYTATFTNKVFEVQTTTETIPATGHSWGDPTYEWTTNYSSVTATRVCGNDASHVETQTVQTTSAETKEATCTEKGETTYTAVFTQAPFQNQTKTVANIDALNHNWGTATYIWANDNGSVTASHTCGRCSLSETEQSETVYADNPEATCTTKGTRIYTATFEKDGFTEQTKPVELPVLDHHMTAHVANGATCTAEGNSAYWSCDQCGKYFSDENGNSAIEKDSWVIGKVAHTLEKQKDAVDATCTTAGNIAYWKCSVCKKYFSDSAGTTEIQEDDWVIGALGHNWGTPTYKWTDDQYSEVTATRICANNRNHTETETATNTNGQISVKVTKQPADCRDTTETTFTATFNNTAFATQKKVMVTDGFAHTMMPYSANAATCTTPGNSAYWKCTMCNHYYADKDGNTRINEGSWDIPQTGHKWSTEYTWLEDNSAVTGKAVCQNDGNHTVSETVKTTYAVSKDSTCKVTGTGVYMASFTKAPFTKQTKNVSIALKAHTPETDAAVEATCSTEGKTEGSHCSVCGDVIVAQTSVAKKAHTPVTDSAVAATCSAEGKTEGSHCSVCGDVIVAQTSVAKKAHTPVTDAAVAATCTKDGLTEGSHCSVCGDVIVAQKKIDATGHTEVVDAAVAATCTKDGLTEGSHCSVCGDVIVEQKKVDATGHTEEVDKAVAASCTKDGLTEGSHCSVCGDVIVAQEKVDALGHKEVIDAAVAATTEKTGLTEGKHCERCGEVLVAQKVVPQLELEPDPEPEPEPEPEPKTPEEKVAAFVKRCYKLILNREADEGGLNGWSEALTNKTATAAQIIDGFVRSDEFVNRNLSNEEAVDILYKTMLDRPADEGGKAGWTDALNQGYTLQNIIDGFCGSAEFTNICDGFGIAAGSVNAAPPSSGAAADTPRGKIEAFVSRCYQLILNRQADQGGLQGWSDALEQRVAAAAQIIDGFVRSDEYANRNLSAGESVDILYNTMLGREADEGGKAGWVDALGQGYTLQHIINGFCGSAEFTAICDSYGIVAGSVAVSGAMVKREAITPEGEEAAPVVIAEFRSEFINEEKIRAFVEHCYKAVFGREGDAEGIENYMKAILDGKKTPKKVAYEFVFSPEFQNNLPGNEEFIRILYRLYFDREPGAEELSGWVKMLENGASLEEIVDGFAGSQEFKVIVNEMKE